MFRRLIGFLFAACIAVAAQAGVDANRASQAELESVKGIGPALSSRILQARASAPFKDWPDLIDRVQGVGNGNAARYSQAGLTVAGAAFEMPAVKAEAAAPRKPRAEKMPAK
jgi:competence protein ComEA